MEPVAENRGIVTRESFDPEIEKEYPSMKNILDRMADLKFKFSDIPLEMRRRMSVTETDKGFHFDFIKSSKSVADLVKSPHFLYKIAFLLKTDPSILYLGDGFSELKADDHFVPIDADTFFRNIAPLMGIYKIKARFRKYRREKEITVSKAADILNVSDGTLRNYESINNDTLKLTTEQLFRFSKECGISPDLVMLGMHFEQVLYLVEHRPEMLTSIENEEKMIKPIADSGYFAVPRTIECSVGNIIACRQWIIDNLDQLDAKELFRVKDFIKNQMRPYHISSMSSHDNDDAVDDE